MKIGLDHSVLGGVVRESQGFISVGRDFCI
jgi:hypothetical protein